MTLNLPGIALIILSSFAAIPAQGTEMLHPVCMERLLSEPEASADSQAAVEHDLTECLNSSKSLPFEKLSEYYARFNLPEDNKDKSLPVFVEYKIIGSLTNHQTLVQITSNYGGTMIFSGGLVITDNKSGKQRKVTVQQEISGGDRCFGGIEKLSITAPDTIEVSRRITTAELLQLNTQSDDPVDGVAGCAICCIGTATEQIQLGHPPRLRRIQLNRTLSPTQYSKHQGCFNELTGSLSEQHPLVMNAEQLQLIQQHFTKDCLSRAQ